MYPIKVPIDWLATSQQIVPCGDARRIDDKRPGSKIPTLRICVSTGQRARRVVLLLLFTPREWTTIKRVARDAEISCLLNIIADEFE